jgi:hypothetical protein
MLKPSTVVIYECLSQARVFVPRKSLQPILMFVSKASARLSEMLRSRAGSWPYSQTLD